MKRWYRKKFHRYGRQVHRMPEMQCPICGVVVTDIVMKVPPDRAFCAAQNAVSISSSGVQHLSYPS